MGILRKFRVGKRLLEFDSYLVNISKDRANRVSKSLKELFGNRVKIRVVKADSGKGWDLFTHPQEELFHKLRRKKWWGVIDIVRTGVSWTETRNIVAKTAKEAKKLFQKMAKDIGMKATGIKTDKRGALRSGGNPVYRVTGTWREILKRKKW